MSLRHRVHALLRVWGSSVTGSAARPEAKCLILGDNDGEKLVRRWGYPFLLKIDETRSGARQFIVGAETIPPRKGIHVHKHEYAEELLIINSGSGTATLGDQVAPVGKGTVIFIPRRTWHGLANTGDDDINLLWIFPKPGMDRYFRATSLSDCEKSLPLSREELGRIRRRFGNYVTYKDDNLVNYVDTV